MAVRIVYPEAADGHRAGSVYEVGDRDESVSASVARATAAHPHAKISHVVEYDAGGNPHLHDYDAAMWSAKRAGTDEPVAAASVGLDIADIVDDGPRDQAEAEAEPRSPRRVRG